MKKPIEEKFKDFLKLAKWDYSNYYRLKESVEKSHKTIVKILKEYEVNMMKIFFVI